MWWLQAINIIIMAQRVGLNKLNNDFGKTIYILVIQ
jgi:hypothetical protein